MSAFMVSDAHITALLQAMVPQYPGQGTSYHFAGKDHKFEGRAAELAQILVDQNRRSVNRSYGREEHHLFNEYGLDCAVIARTPVEVIKLCDCYHYQAADSEGYEQTRAWAIVNAIRERAIDRLPGYQSAEWSVPAFALADSCSVQ